MKPYLVQIFGITALALLGGLWSCSPAKPRGRLQNHSNEVRILLDQPPQTLNPRMALDANGQRLGSLVFSALTRVNQNLDVVPDLAESWRTSPDGLQWRFKIRSRLKDHAGKAIAPEDITQCLENYRVGSPPSRLQAAFPSWTSTRTEGDEVVLKLEKPDAYLTRNLSSLRYFRIQGDILPCQDPELKRTAGPIEWIGSGPYQFPKNLGVSSGGPFTFVPANGAGPSFVFVVIRDELQRLMALLRGEVDLGQNALSLTRTRWLAEKHSDQFSLIERAGVNVSYIAFNLKDPILSHRSVRKALAHAVPRQEFVDYKMARFGTLAGSLLSPLLPEGIQLPFEYDPKLSNSLLDQAGFARDRSGYRFRLKYRTTPVREGMETALVLQNAWEKVGVKLELDIVEPAAFLTAIRKGSFQLYSSRWVGVADGSILHRTMRSGSLNNRVNFQKAEADQMLDRLMATPSLEGRLQDARALQKLMMEELPYFPLWHWGNAVLIRKDLKSELKADDLSLSGAFEPLIKALARRYQPTPSDEVGK